MGLWTWKRFVDSSDLVMVYEDFLYRFEELIRVKSFPNRTISSMCEFPIMLSLPSQLKTDGKQSSHTTDKLFISSLFSSGSFRFFSVITPAVSHV